MLTSHVFHTCIVTVSQYFFKLNTYVDRQHQYCLKYAMTTKHFFLAPTDNRPDLSTCLPSAESGRLIIVKINNLIVVKEKYKSVNCLSGDYLSTTRSTVTSVKHLEWSKITTIKAPNRFTFFSRKKKQPYVTNPLCISPVSTLWTVHV